MHSKNTVFVILFHLIIILISTSCTVKPVELKSIDGFNVIGIQNKSVTVKISATIENPNPRLKIKSSDLVLSMGNSEIGKIKQLENIILKGKSKKSYTTSVKFELTGNAFSLMSLYKQFERKKKDFKISGTIKVTAPFYFKTIKFTDYQVFK